MWSRTTGPKARVLHPRVTNVDEERTRTEPWLRSGTTEAKAYTDVTAMHAMRTGNEP